jgi:hypothetical protein
MNTLTATYNTETTETFGIYCCNICVKHIQHPNENACNIRLEQMKHFEQTSETHATHATCATSLIYFCNIQMKQL